MTSTNSVIAICTRNRPQDLERCIRACISANALGRSIYVVDSSDTKDSFYVCQNLSNATSEIFYFQSEPGLTLQRNNLISKLPKSTEIVHFIDDDSVVSDSYFDKLEAVFLENPLAVGAGGRILYLPKQTSRPFDLMFGVASKGQGVVLKSGVNILNFDGELRKVDWLSGCSMSFRYSIFSSCSFDEKRSGNGIGEDVDFCLRAGKHGPILWTPEATQMHIQSSINRLSYKANRKKVLDHRLRLAQDRLAGVNAANVYISFYYEEFKSNICPFIKRLVSKRGN